MYFIKFGDVHEKIIVNFPQSLCLVGTSRRNLVKIKLQIFTVLLIHEISVP